MLPSFHLYCIAFAWKDRERQKAWRVVRGVNETQAGIKPRPRCFEHYSLRLFGRRIKKKSIITIVAPVVAVEALQADTQDGLHPWFFFGHLRKDSLLLWGTLICLNRTVINVPNHRRMQYSSLHRIRSCISCFVVYQVWKWTTTTLSNTPQYV